MCFRVVGLYFVLGLLRLLVVFWGMWLRAICAAFGFTLMLVGGVDLLVLLPCWCGLVFYDFVLIWCV